MADDKKAESTVKMPDLPVDTKQTGESLQQADARKTSASSLKSVVSPLPSGTSGSEPVQADSKLISAEPAKQASESAKKSSIPSVEKPDRQIPTDKLISTSIEACLTEQLVDDDGLKNSEIPHETEEASPESGHEIIQESPAKQPVKTSRTGSTDSTESVHKIASDVVRTVINESVLASEKLGSQPVSAASDSASKEERSLSIAEDSKQAKEEKSVQDGKPDVLDSSEVGQENVNIKLVSKSPVSEESNSKEDASKQTPSERKQSVSANRPDSSSGEQVSGKFDETSDATDETNKKDPTIKQSSESTKQISEVEQKSSLIKTADSLVTPDKPASSSAKQQIVTNQLSSESEKLSDNEEELKNSDDAKQESDSSRKPSFSSPAKEQPQLSSRKSSTASDFHKLTPLEENELDSDEEDFLVFAESKKSVDTGNVKAGKTDSQDNVEPKKEPLNTIEENKLSSSIKKSIQSIELEASKIASAMNKSAADKSAKESARSGEMLDEQTGLNAAHANKLDYQGDANLKVKEEPEALFKSLVDTDENVKIGPTGGLKSEPSETKSDSKKETKDESKSEPTAKQQQSESKEFKSVDENKSPIELEQQRTVSSGSEKAPDKAVEISEKKLEKAPEKVPELASIQTDEINAKTGEIKTEPPEKKLPAETTSKTDSKTIEPERKPSLVLLKLDDSSEPEKQTKQDKPSDSGAVTLEKSPSQSVDVKLPKRDEADQMTSDEKQIERLVNEQLSGLNIDVELNVDQLSKDIKDSSSTKDRKQSIDKPSTDKPETEKPSDRKTSMEPIKVEPPKFGVGSPGTSSAVATDLGSTSEKRESLKQTGLVKRPNELKPDDLRSNGSSIQRTPSPSEQLDSKSLEELENYSKELVQKASEFVDHMKEDAVLESDVIEEVESLKSDRSDQSNNFEFELIPSGLERRHSHAAANQPQQQHEDSLLRRASESITSSFIPFPSKQASSTLNANDCASNRSSRSSLIGASLIGVASMNSAIVTKRSLTPEGERNIFEALKDTVKQEEEANSRMDTGKDESRKQSSSEEWSEYEKIELKDVQDSVKTSILSREESSSPIGKPTLTTSEPLVSTESNTTTTILSAGTTDLVTPSLSIPAVSLTIQNVQQSSDSKTDVKSDVKSEEQKRKEEAESRVQNWSKPLGLPTNQKPLIELKFKSRDPKQVVCRWQPLGLPSPFESSLDKNVSKNLKPQGSSAKSNQQAALAGSDQQMLTASITNDSSIASLKPFHFDLIYVAHHGERDYNHLEFFKKCPSKNYVLSASSPSRATLDAFLEAKKQLNSESKRKDKQKAPTPINLIPTHESESLFYWISDRQKELEQEAIEVAPSASRCSCTLESHESEVCTSYRIQF